MRVSYSRTNDRGEVGTDKSWEEPRSVAEQCPSCPSRLEKAHSALWASGRGCLCTSPHFPVAGRARSSQAAGPTETAGISPG